MVEFRRQQDFAEKPNIIFEGCGQGGGKGVLKYIASKAETPVQIEITDEISRYMYHLFTGDPLDTIKIDRAVNFLFRPGPIRIYATDWRGLIELGRRRPTDFARLSKTQLGKDMLNEVGGLTEKKLDELLTNNEAILFAQKEDINPITKKARLLDTGKWRPFSDGRLIGPVFLTEKLFTEAVANGLLHGSEVEEATSNKRKRETGKYRLNGKRKRFINHSFVDTTYYTAKKDEITDEWKIVPTEIAAAFYIAGTDGGTGTAMGEAHADLMNADSRRKGYLYVGETERSRPVVANVQYPQFLAGTLPTTTAPDVANQNVVIRILNAIDRGRKLSKGLKPEEIKKIAINGDIMFSRAGAVKAYYRSEIPHKLEPTNNLDKLMADYFLNLTYTITEPSTRSSLSQATMQELLPILSGVILPATIKHDKKRPQHLEEIVEDVVKLVSPMSLAEDGGLQGFSVDPGVPAYFMNTHKLTHEEYIAAIVSKFTFSDDEREDDKIPDDKYIDVDKFTRLRPETLSIDHETIPPEYITPTSAVLFVNGPELEKEDVEIYLSAVRHMLQLVFPNLRSVRAVGGKGPENRTSLALCGGGTVSYEMLDIMVNNLSMYPSYKRLSKAPSPDEREKHPFVRAMVYGDKKALDEIIPNKDDLPYENDRMVQGNLYNRACRDAALYSGKLMKGKRATYNLRHIFNAIHRPEMSSKLRKSYVAPGYEETEEEATEEIPVLEKKKWYDVPFLRKIKEKMKRGGKK